MEIKGVIKNPQFYIVIICAKLYRNKHYMCTICGDFSVERTCWLKTDSLHLTAQASPSSVGAMRHVDQQRLYEMR